MEYSFVVITRYFWLCSMSGGSADCAMMHLSPEIPQCSESRRSRFIELLTCIYLCSYLFSVFRALTLVEYMFNILHIDHLRCTVHIRQMNEEHSKKSCSTSLFMKKFPSVKKITLAPLLMLATIFRYGWMKSTQRAVVAVPFYGTRGWARINRFTCTYQDIPGNSDPKFYS